MRIENENDYEKALERRNRLWDSGFVDASEELDLVIEAYAFDKVEKKRQLEHDIFTKIIDSKVISSDEELALILERITELDEIHSDIEFSQELYDQLCFLVEDYELAKIAKERESQLGIVVDIDDL